VLSEGTSRGWALAIKKELPPDPLGFIKKCVKERRVFWTYHVNMRMKDRSIPRWIILESVSDYEIIEEYPKDKYLPTYLVYSRHQNTVFHILFATDV
jgi:hypothetical protein